jgi:hypothetical protein
MVYELKNKSGDYEIMHHIAVLTFLAGQSISSCRPYPFVLDVRICEVQYNGRTYIIIAPSNSILTYLK